MTPRELLTDIHALEEDLMAFERKYGLRSETFYAAYIVGEEPEHDDWVLDFGEWASVYRTWLARQLGRLRKCSYRSWERRVVLVDSERTSKPGDEYNSSLPEPKRRVPVYLQIALDYRNEIQRIQPQPDTLTGLIHAAT